MHDHTHPPAQYHSAFIWGIVLNIGFVLAELVFGFLTHSLALLADAGHNATDVIGLALAWGASLLARRRATSKRTYGWRSSSILAALLNAELLLVAVSAIAWEAIRRLPDPPPVASTSVMVVAALGMLVNGATAILFHRGRKHDLNVRGAFLHMAADAGVSAGVLLAGLGILLTGWQWLDPIVSLGIAGVIFLSTWGLLRDSVNLALHAVPPEIQTTAVEAYLRSLPGVAGLHDLHIWAMSTTESALTVHLCKPDPHDDDNLLTRIHHELLDRFGIAHSTVQWERIDSPPPCRVPCTIHG